MARDWKATLKKLTVGAIRNAVRGYKFSAAAARKKETLVEEASQLEGEWRHALEAAVGDEVETEAGPSSGVAAGHMADEWKAKLHRLSREQIMGALDLVGGYDLGYLARRRKNALVEEVSRLGGEFRKALESAVFDKEGEAIESVS